jgi:hypothetical protein
LDDCGSLRNTALVYIPRIKNIPNIDHTTKKEQQGFCHHMTARLLCPRQRRDDFDADMEGFCHSVQNGTLIITHNHWPSFLYPEDEYNPEAIDEHLLRGEFLLSVRLSFLSMYSYALNPFLVFSTSLHWSAHWFQNNARKGARKKMPGGSIQYDHNIPRNNCICRSVGAPLTYFRLIFIFI